MPSTTTLIIILLLVFVLLFGRRILAVLLVRFVGRKALKALGDNALARQPASIVLSKVSAPAWGDPATIESLAAPLRASGFDDAGVFTVDKMPGVKVQILVNSAQGVAAHIYEHPKAGRWLELVTRYPDGSLATLSTLPPTGLDRPSWMTTIHSEKASSQELVQRLLRERPAKSPKPVTTGSAAREFELGYMAHMLWMKNKGLAVHEVAAVVKKWAEKKAGA